MNKKLPLSIRDTSPHPDAEKIDSFHTGGVWMWQGEAWKGLDGRPYANADFHIETDELKVLHLMAGEPFFPKNWRTEERNGRFWLVRKVAYRVPEDISYQSMGVQKVLELEQAVRALNAKNWEVNDNLQIAQDPDTHEFFILDLSAAQEMKGMWPASDGIQIERFMESCGMDAIAKLRKKARFVVQPFDFEDKHQRDHRLYRHVYASFNRPISAMWTRIPGDPVYEHTGKARWTEGVPHTWVITKEPLPESVMKSYELEWGWSPVHPPKEGIHDRY